MKKGLEGVKKLVCCALGVLTHSNSEREAAIPVFEQHNS